MAETSTPTCDKCGTPLVPAKEPLKIDGSLTMDGSWDMGDMVCPKCHPELVKAE